MTIDLTKTIFSSQFGGLGNFADVTFTGVVPSQSIPLFGFIQVVVSTPLANANMISQIQLNFGGLETTWRLCSGVLLKNFPDNVSISYNITCITYFTSSSLNVLIVISNQTGGALIIPTITTNIRANLYRPPF